MSEENRGPKHRLVSGLFIGVNVEEGVIGLSLADDDETDGLITHMTPLQAVRLTSAIGGLVADFIEKSQEEMINQLDQMVDAEENVGLVMPPEGLVKPN